MDIAHWTPDITILTAFNNLNYQAASLYFLNNLLIVSMALLFGAGFISLLKRNASVNVCLRASEHVFLSVAAGLAIIIGELFFIALMGHLTPSVVSGAFAITAMSSLFELIRSSRNTQYLRQYPQNWLAVFITIIFFTLLLVLQYSSAHSETIGDSTSFHVPYADFFLKNHGLAVNYQLIYPFHTLNINLLYSLALMLTHELSYVQTVHALFATLTMFGLYIAAVHFNQKQWIALLLPFIFIGTYTINVAGYMANVDLGSMFFIFSATFALMIWKKNPNAYWLLVCSAMSLGIAMGTKYIMCIFAIPLAAIIILQSRKNCMRPLLFYAAVTFAWGSWWYIRNFVMAGNPVHPFASNIFGYFLWNEFDMLNQMENLHNEYIPRNMLSFLTAPYFAFQNPTLNEFNTAHILTAFYITIPLVYFAERNCRFLLIPCLSYLLFWVLSSADPRYFMPLIPLIFIYTGSCISGLITAATPQWVQYHSGAKITAALLGVLLSFLALAFGLLETQQRFIKILYSESGPVNSHSYLMNVDETYALFYKANEVFGSDTTVYEFFSRDYRWFFKGNLVGNQFGENGYWRILDNIQADCKFQDSEYKLKAPFCSATKLEATLKSLYSAQGVIIPSSMISARDQRQFDEYFSVAYRNNAGTLYRFKNEQPLEDIKPGL